MDISPLRRLVVIDLENLLGVPPAQAHALHWRSAAEQLFAAIAFRSGIDHAIVATNPQWAFDAADAVPGGRLLVRHGESGADGALCEVLADVPYVRSRFASVVIGSGDHIFAAPVAGLTAAGVPVQVVSLGLGASSELLMAANHTVLLPRPELALAA